MWVVETAMFWGVLEVLVQYRPLVYRGVTILKRFRPLGICGRHRQGLVKVDGLLA